MKCLFFMYSFTQQVLCIPYLSSFFTSPGLSFCQMHILFPFLSGFVEICCSAFPFLCPSPLFKRNSRISSLLFIVCSAIPLYQLQFWATEVISFCIGGSEEQRYVRPRAAYLSNANRLDLSKSHWNHITYSSSAKYLQNEEGVKTGETNISVFFLSPHGQTPFYTLTFVFAWQRVGPPTVILQSEREDVARAVGFVAKQPACAAAAAVEQTWSQCNYFHYHRHATQSDRDGQGENWGDSKWDVWNLLSTLADWERMRES